MTGNYLKPALGRLGRNVAITLLVARGCVLSVALGLAINTAMAASMQLRQLSLGDIGGGALIVVVLGPALRAPSVSLAIATRVS